MKIFNSDTCDRL